MKWALNSEDEQILVEELLTLPDRAAAIVAAALVDSKLAEYLKFRWPADPSLRDRLFKPAQLIGSFGARVDMGRMLGLYSADTHNDLQRIGKVRNQFAHDFRAITFKDNDVQQRVREIRVVDRHLFDLGSTPDPELIVYLAVENLAHVRSDTRLRFIAACVFFASQFESRATGHAPLF